MPKCYDDVSKNTARFSLGFCLICCCHRLFARCVNEAGLRFPLGPGWLMPITFCYALCTCRAFFFWLPSSRNFRTALLLVRGLYVTRLTKLLGLRFSSASSSLYLCTAFRSLRHQIKCIYTCAEYLSIYKTRRRLRLRWESPGFSLKCWCNCANGESFVLDAFLPYGWRRGRAGIFIKKSTERADEQRGGLRFDYIPLCRPLEMRVNWLDARFSSESRRGGQKLKRTQLDTIVRQPLRLPPFISPIRLVCVVWETVSNIFPCRRLLESLKCLPMRIAILRWLLFCSKLPSSSSSSYITRGMCGEKRSERIFFSLSYDVCRGSRALNRVTFSSVHQPPTKKEKIESKPEWNPGCGTKADAVARNPQSRATIECSKTLPPFSRDPSSSSRWDWRRKSRRIL